MVGDKGHRQPGNHPWLTETTVPDSSTGTSSVPDPLHDSQTHLPAGSPAPPQTRYEHYEIQRREDGSLWTLGSGAMGATYKAFDTRLHCIVALKVVHGALLTQHPVLRERFLREARAAASVRHPNIASVFHLGEAADGQCFYAMEFIDGETVAERVRRRGPLPPLQALEVTAQVTHALVVSGQADLIHRDIKPSNVMLIAHGLVDSGAGRALSGHDSDGGTSSIFAKVIDFGLVRTITPDAGHSLTVAGDFVGTPHYASPEQLAGEDERIDIRSDIYSLGSTLWFMLTGRQPFAGGSFEEIQKLQRRALPVEQLREAAVPAPLVDLLKLMLAPNPNRRPQTPVMLAEDLGRCRQALLEAIRASGGGSTAGRPGTAFAGGIVPTWRTWLTLGIATLTLCTLLAAGWLAWSNRHRLAGAPGPIPEKSIAVLPFANLSADQENAFFTDGVQDEILTDLAKVADLKVISRSSVMQYKSDAPRNLREIAAQLGVANVLEGSVQRAGNQVRVNAQLINARTDAHLWAEHYDRPLDDLFAIQSDIAQAIARELRARLSPQEKSAINERPTADLPAFDLYLRARSLHANTTDRVLAQQALPQAVRILDEAVSRDPNFLSAWCLLSRVHCDIYFYGIDHTSARLDQAHAALQSAGRLQPDAGETHLAEADYYYSGFRDYDRASSALELARRTLPNNAEISEYTGYIDRRQGRWTEAVRHMERALELDPRSFYMLQQTALTYWCMHRYDDSARLMKRALLVVPGDPFTRLGLDNIELDAHANVKPFQATLAALLKEDPSLAPQLDDPLYGLCERTPEAAARVLANYPREGSAIHGTVWPHAYIEGVVARWQGDAPRARAAFTSARSEVAKTVAEQPDLAIAVSLLGLIDAGLGRKDDALREGRRACELLPISKDALDGAFIAANLAQIDAWVGEKAAAVEQLKVVNRGPSFLSYGELKLHPQWDVLRGDPGFEAVVASFAPK